MEKKKIKKRLIAYFTLIIMVLNMFGTYGSLFNISYAAIDKAEPYLAIVNGYDENDEYFEDIKADYEDYGIIPIYLVLGGTGKIGGLDINFSYDKDVLTPAYNAGTPRRPNYQIATSMNDWDPMMSVISSTYSDNNTCMFNSEGRIRMEGTLSSGGNTYVDVTGTTVTIAEMYFFVNDGYTIDDIKSDMFELVKGATGLVTGLEIVYSDGINSVYGNEHFTVEGFSQAENGITNFLVTNPSKLDYAHGDDIDLTGSNVTIEYLDGTKYEDTLNKAIEDGKVTINNTKADFQNQKLKITSVEDTTQFIEISLNVKDELEKIELTTIPQKISYDTSENIDLTGGIITATTKSGVTSTITLPSNDIGISDIKADISKVTNKWITTSGLEAGNQTITLSYTDTNSITKTISYTIVVNDKISNINVKTNPDKLIYKYGESLDKIGGIITVETQGGASFDLPMTDGAVSVNSFKEKPTSLPSVQNLTASYAGITSSNSFEVTVKNYITKLSYGLPSKLIYQYNEPFDYTDGTVAAKFANGTSSPSMALDSSNTTGYNPNVIGKQNLTISYIDNDINSYTYGQTFTENFEVQVNDYISNIEIIKPTDLEFDYGTNFTVGGGTAKIYYASKPTEPEEIAVTTSMVKQTADASEVNMTPAKEAFNRTNNKYDEQLTITVVRGGISKTANYTISIYDNITSINMAVLPKTTYNVKESLDVTGGKVNLTRASGYIEEIDLSKCTVAGFDSTEENASIPLTVSYTENGITKTTTFDVVVKDTVTGINVKGTPKTEYKYGEELEKLTIEVTSGKGTKDIEVTPDMINGYDKNILGEQTVTIEYGVDAQGNPVTTTFKVTVKDYVTGIEVTPNTVQGTYNQELVDLITNNNIKYIVTYAKEGKKPEATLEARMVTGYNKTSIQEQNLVITYEDNDVNSSTKGEIFTTNLKVTLDDPVASIELTTDPTITEYGYGDTINLTGGKVTVTKQSTATEEIDLSNPEISVTEEDGTPLDLSKVTFGENKKATKTIKVTYEGKETTFTVTVINKITKIEMYVTPKTNYNVNETLNLSKEDGTKGQILVTRQTGNPEAIYLDNSNVKITGFDSTKENTSLPLTVSYTENGITKTTTFDVVVKDTVTGINVKGTPKTEYKYGEELEKLTIEVTSGKGTKDIEVTPDMINGYDKNILGEQTVTIEYGVDAQGNPVTTTFKVTVKDYITGIEVTPNTVQGTYNQELQDLITNNNIKYIVTYAKEGKKPEATLEARMVTGYNKTSIQEQNLVVTYEDNDVNSSTRGEIFTTNLKVTLADVVKEIVVTAPTKEQKYNHNETLDLTGSTITVKYESGANEKTITPTAIMVVEQGTTNQVNMAPTSYDVTNKVTKNVTLKYEEGGKTGEISYPITIINDVKSIVVNKKPKTSYNVNESLDITGGKVTITRAVGTEEIDLSKCTVTGFDSTKENTSLPLTVSYEENGITKTTIYNVVVKDIVTGINVKGTPKTEYKYGEELEKLTIEVTSGKGTKDIEVTPDMISGYDKNILGEQTVTIEYGVDAQGNPVTTTFKVTVKDYITGIVLTPPTKVTYEYGESLDLTGGSIQKVMASGIATTKVELSNSQVTLSEFNPNKIGAQTINVTYEGKTEQFAVLVEDNIKSIVIKNTPKVNYKYGEALDVTNGTIETIRSSGERQEVAITASMVMGYNPNTLGDQTLTVTYSGKSDTYQVNVKDYIIGIEIVRPTKQIYKLNEPINLAGGTVKVMNASGKLTSPVAMTLAMISGFDSSSVGDKTIKVSYKGFSKTFGVTVQDIASSMTIKDLPNKLDYLYGESLDLKGGTIEVTKESGNTEIINITKDMVTGYNSKKLGKQTLTITYKGFTQEFSVNVEDYVSKLRVDVPDKVEYEYGESLDLTNGSVSIIMASGKVDEKVDMTASMLTGYDKTKEGTQTIKVNYKDLQGSFQVRVVDKVKGISINTEPNKTNYKYGESLDVTGATITVVKSSGITTVTVEKDMISGYNPKNSGTQVITVNYGGFKANFIVMVEKQEEIKTDDNEENNEGKNEGKNETNNEANNESEKTDPKPSENTNKPQINNQNTTPSINDNYVVEQDKQANPEDNLEQGKDITEDAKDNLQKENEKEDKKPSQTLGVKDEKKQEDNKYDSKVIAGTIATLGLVFLLFLIFLKRNVKILVHEDGEFVLGGVTKVTKKKLYINVDPYLDGETYKNKVKIILNDSISEKLDGKELEIKHRGQVINAKVKYEDKPYEIILE